MTTATEVARNEFPLSRERRPGQFRAADCQLRLQTYHVRVGHQARRSLGKLIHGCLLVLHFIKYSRDCVIRLKQRIVEYYWWSRHRLALTRDKVRGYISRPNLGVLAQYPPRPMKFAPGYDRPIPLRNPPLISVVTPSFNQASFLEQTLKSVLDQNYPRLEFVVQDGGSKDGTVSLLERHADRLHHWESRPDHGQSHAINLGFAHTSGEIMAYLNSDDLLLPGALNYVAAYFEKHPEIDVVYGHRVIIDSEGFEIGRWIIPRHDSEVLRWADYVPQETLFWRREIWNRAGGRIDESFQFAMDWDLLLRFQEAGARFARLPRFLGAFRVHETQKTSSQMTTRGFEEMDILRRRCHGRDVTAQEVADFTVPYVRRGSLYSHLYGMGLLRY